MTTLKNTTSKPTPFPSHFPQAFNKFFHFLKRDKSFPSRKTPLLDLNLPFQNASCAKMGRFCRPINFFVRAHEGFSGRLWSTNFFFVFVYVSVSGFLFLFVKKEIFLKRKT